MEETIVPLDTVNDIRSMDATGRSRSEIARVLHVSRNIRAKYAGMEVVSPTVLLPQGRDGPVFCFNYLGEFVLASVQAQSRVLYLIGAEPGERTALRRIIGHFRWLEPAFLLGFAVAGILDGFPVHLCVEVHGPVPCRPALRPANSTASGTRIPHR